MIFFIILISTIFARAEIKVSHPEFVFPEEIKKFLLNGSELNRRVSESVPKLVIKSVMNIGQEEANKKFLDRKIFFNNLNGIDNSPYAGQITRTLTCPNLNAEPRVEKNSAKEFQSISFYFETNKYFSYGVCDEGERIHSGVTRLLFCKGSGAFLEVNFYDKKESNLTQLVEKIECANLIGHEKSRDSQLPPTSAKTQKLKNGEIL